MSTATAARAGTTVSFGDPLAETIFLPLKNQAAAEAEAVAIQTPGNPDYHHFLSVSEFVSRYALTDADIAAVETALKALGFGIAYVLPNHLGIQVTGTPSLLAQAFGTTLRTLAADGRTGLVPAGALKLPAALQGLVLGVGGLDTFHHAHPHYVRTPNAAAAHPALATPRQLLPGNIPGNYLPATFEHDYDVDPLYARGLTGAGRTIGIVTLNSFNTADAFSFWQQIGLSVNPDRITLVDVDGGLTAATNNSGGEGETDIDVEESGSIAPAADERVYVAPNETNANFIDGFEAAASENIADTISSSWGEAELDYFANFVTGTPDQTYMLQAFHLAFLELALQGQTVFIAAGDSGSYDKVDECPFYGTPTPSAPTCNAPFALDQPSDDPLTTASGGTTLAFTSTFMGVNLSIAHEQAWGWRYLATQAAAQGLSNVFNIPDVFSVGGGGGVSSYWLLPWYQLATPGIQLTEPGQVLTENTGAGPKLATLLLPDFPGRNSPDIVTNADPFSGYQYLEEGVVQNGYGGTSFVAPQLNGVNALFNEGLGTRVGQLNPALYQLGAEASRDIMLGNIWGYDARPGYDQATGNGALDAAKLLAGLEAR